jgi:hypothetical protein
VALKERYGARDCLTRRSVSCWLPDLLAASAVNGVRSRWDHLKTAYFALLLRTVVQVAHNWATGTMLPVWTLGVDRQSKAGESYCSNRRRSDGLAMIVNFGPPALLTLRSI